MTIAEYHELVDDGLIHAENIHAVVQRFRPKEWKLWSGWLLDAIDRLDEVWTKLNNGDCFEHVFTDLHPIGHVVQVEGVAHVVRGKRHPLSGTSYHNLVSTIIDNVYDSLYAIRRDRESKKKKEWLDHVEFLRADLVKEIPAELHVCLWQEYNRVPSQQELRQSGAVPKAPVRPLKPLEHAILRTIRQAGERLTKKQVIAILVKQDESPGTIGKYLALMVKKGLIANDDDRKGYYIP